MAELMHDFILKVLTRFITCWADSCRQIGTPAIPRSFPMLSPTERDQVEPERVPDRRIVFVPDPINRGKPIQRQPSGQSGILIRKRHAAPVDRRSRRLTPSWYGTKPDQEKKHKPAKPS